MSAHPSLRRRLSPGPAARRNRPARRSAGGRTRVRAGAALLALASAGAIYGVASSSAFDYARLRVEPQPVYTDPIAVEQALSSVRGQNVFRLDTTPLRTALLALRTVDTVRVSVQLPDTLVVDLHEREPILIWKVGARRYLVDVEGNLFAKLGDDPTPSTASLPVVDDQRAAAAGLAVGTALDPTDLDAATRLGSLTPVQVGSAATGLSVILTDENGFVLKTRSSGWSAVFGFYTATLRTPALIPGQVRLLRSLLVGRESIVDRVILASDTDGTYIARPSSSPDANPGSTVRPTAKPTTTPTTGPSASPDGSPSPSPSAAG